MRETRNAGAAGSRSGSFLMKGQTVAGCVCNIVRRPHRDQSCVLGGSPLQRRGDIRRRKLQVGFVIEGAQQPRVVPHQQVKREFFGGRPGVSVPRYWGEVG